MSDVSQILNDIDSLVRQGAGVCAMSGDQDLEPFIAAIDSYLLNFEQWQGRFSAADQTKFSEEDKAKVRLKLTTLSESHQQVLTVAVAGRERVGASMGSIRRRATVLRTYIDQLPSRITIAGKREG